jgi:hypothetical protein
MLEVIPFSIVPTTGNLTSKLQSKLSFFGILQNGASRRSGGCGILKMDENV